MTACPRFQQTEERLREEQGCYKKKKGQEKTVQVKTQAMKNNENSRIGESPVGSVGHISRSLVGGIVCQGKEHGFCPMVSAEPLKGF